MEIADFNPNAAVENLVKRAKELLGDRDGLPDGYVDQENAEKLAEYVICLDAYLRKPTSYLPACWIKPEELKCECGQVYLSEPGHTGLRLCRKCEKCVDANPNRQGLKP